MVAKSLPPPIKRYPLPWKAVLPLAGSLLRSGKRSFRFDALRCLTQIEPLVHVCGLEQVPIDKPCLVVVNHYSRTGLFSGWLALIISALLPVEVHWIITAAWTYPGGWKKKFLTPVSRKLFRWVAAVYDFVSMPPMPPDANEIPDRARAVRKTLELARKRDRRWIGLAPEGRDSPGCVLQRPPKGVGRFIEHVARAGYFILPAGLYEDGERLCVRFGEPFHINSEAAKSPAGRDALVSAQVMQAIAQLLPLELRGVYSDAGV